MSDLQKKNAGEAAAAYVEAGMVVGLGTGSTAAWFVKALAARNLPDLRCVPTSERTADLARELGLTLSTLEDTPRIDLTVDGADECDPHKRLIKGGGAALTREKIIAEASKQFVCIIDPSKQVPVLGKFPLPVEVIPMARSLVAREILALTGGQPVWRDGTVTDNGNVILDIHNLSITDPMAMEREINQIPGVVSVGLFARRPADIVIVGGEPPVVLR